ncbi:MAG: NAD(P)/FAD-dependent oxidoreductase [Nitrospinaceae bacterium]|nr:NAD(P)/FAD-dependent oxidoreductase [Nitrospinaceae bacterium]
MNGFDVIIIGGGPAGCAMALDLNLRGYEVALCDQAKFPRDKVCGEFISPGADPILEQLGVLDAIEALSPQRLKGVAISSYESQELEIDYPVSRETDLRPSSLSVPRYQLDALFLERVQNAGVKIFQQHKVTGFVFDQDCVVGVQGWDENKTPFTLKAKLVVDAGGRNALSLKKFSLKRQAQGRSRIAFAAHWQGVEELNDYCHMHVSQPGYTGISAVGKDRANVVLVVDASAFRDETVETFYHRVLMKNSRRRKILLNGERLEPVRSVESLGFGVKPVSCGGLVLVGDAMGFIDPFTGEGIYLSLRSSQIAAEVIHAGFQKSDFSREFLAGYNKKRHEEFSGKFMLSRALQWLIYNKYFCDAVMKSLSVNQNLAETLAGVIGDIRPVREIVAGGFLAPLFVGCFSKNRRQ